ncbi:MAG: polysaccharide pyruvyl transferase family protein [Actinobacteria bacterium]|nr:polysaccharide pyruvyl transferase family protein [Actinomycetota bacterium]
MTKRDKPHVLVVNQHGDNRGDEAALLAMCSGIEAELGPTQFTVIHQFNNAAAGPMLRPDARWITLKLPVGEAIRFVVYLALRIFRLRPQFLLGSLGQKTIHAYETADVVVSAPGGPYFGDLYIGHEAVHWLYVWIAKLHRVPAMLYATSAGPFHKKWANPFRRYTYRCFSRLYVREEISAGHIRGLFAGRRHGVNIEVSIDSALQVAIAPQERQHADAQLIVVSAINWPYPNDPSPQLRQKEYDTAVIEAVKIFAESRPTHVVFVPQLYGSMHRDTPYLEALARLLPANISCEVLSDTKSSNEQRALFAAADWVIAGRYHPAVFAVSAAVPVLCIAYEHKATGVLQAAGVPDAVMSIDEATVEVVQAKARELLAARADLSARLQVAQVALREVSSRTSGAVAELARRSMK